MPTDRYDLSFPITVEDALEARRLTMAAWRPWWIVAVVSVVIVGVIAAFLIDFETALNVWAPAFLLFLLPWVDRLIARILLRRRMRTLTGQQGRAIVDARGVHLENPLGSTEVPWSSLTGILDDRREVVLVRDRMHVAYMPVSAFASPAQRAEIVAFARERIANAHFDRVRSGACRD